jgi:hypothetical protein
MNKVQNVKISSQFRREEGNNATKGVQIILTKSLSLLSGGFSILLLA